VKGQARAKALGKTPRILRKKEQCGTPETMKWCTRLIQRARGMNVELKPKRKPFQVANAQHFNAPESGKKNTNCRCWSHDEEKKNRTETKKSCIWNKNSGKNHPKFVPKKK